MAVAPRTVVLAMSNALFVPVWPIALSLDRAQKGNCPLILLNASIFILLLLGLQ